MRILLETFSGMATRPDPAQVGSRFSRNVSFGPAATWIESRPGTEHLTYMLQPSVQDGPDAPTPPTPPPILGDELLSNTGFTEGNHQGDANGQMELGESDTDLTDWAIVPPATHTGVNPIEIDWYITDSGQNHFLDLAGSPGWGGVSQVVSLPAATNYRVTVRAKRNPGTWGPPPIPINDLRQFRVDARVGTDVESGTPIGQETFEAFGGDPGPSGATVYTMDFTTGMAPGDHVISIQYAPPSATSGAIYGIFVYEISLREIIDPDPPPPDPPPFAMDTFAGVYRLKDDRIDPVCIAVATHDTFDGLHGPSLVCPVIFMPLSVVGFGETPSPPGDFEVWWYPTILDAQDYANDIEDRGIQLASGGDEVEWFRYDDENPECIFTLSYIVVRNTGASPISLNDIFFVPPGFSFMGTALTWAVSDQFPSGNFSGLPQSIPPGGEVRFALDPIFTSWGGPEGPYTAQTEMTLDVGGTEFTQGVELDVIQL